MILLAAALAGCGGDDGGSGTPDAGAIDTASADDVLDSVAGALGDALSDTEDAPGLVRFVNLLEQDGAGVDVDVWWGVPEDGNRATTIPYGAASDYLTPQQNAAFDEVSWSASPAGSSEQILGWSYTPADDIRQTLVLFTSESGEQSMMPIDEILEFDPDRGAWGFQPPDSGQVRVKWVPIPGVIEAPSGNLRNVGTGSGDCLTSGSGINAEDDLSTRSTTFQVPAGATVQLYEDFPTCAGPSSASTVAPDQGRAILVAYADAAGDPQLLMLSVRD